MKILFSIFVGLSLSAATPYDLYFHEAGKLFGIEPQLLENIARIESGLNPHAINRNPNGTLDYGLMQINSIHLKRLSRIGITPEALMDPEINIYIGAMLLSSHTRKYGYNLDAIGRYHSATPAHKKAWLARLARVSTSSLPPASTHQNLRTKFAKHEIRLRTNAKIAAGMQPKLARKEALKEVYALLGYN